MTELTIGEVTGMSTTDSRTDRYVDETLKPRLATVLRRCGQELTAAAPAAAVLWTAAARALEEGSSRPGPDSTEAEMLLLDAAADPLGPPWLIVDGLIALIVEQLAPDAQASQVVAVDRSLDGLRQLVGRLHGPPPSRR
jgi:hypothetical protein